MVVEHEQVSTIVDRCRWVLGDDALAHLPAVGIVVGAYDAECLTLATCIVGIAAELLERSVERSHDKVASSELGDSPAYVLAVCHEVL